MLPLYKLERLPAGQRRRKIVLALTRLERTFIEAVRRGSPVSEEDAAYLRGLSTLALEDPKLGAGAVPEIVGLSADTADAGQLLRLCNHVRHALLACIGAFPAEWDLVVSENGSGSDGTVVKRQFHPGVSVYAEDIRSPFNLGSIFRTAEAFGAEKLFVSPLCVPPDHPRALRSAMGCVDYLDWERLPLEALPAGTPVFALETGGTPLDEFDFPPAGIVIIGSEELGISPEGLARAEYGRVSIPMTGMKASLNVGVAFGILMQAWTSYLRCSDSNPF